MAIDEVRAAVGGWAAAPLLTAASGWDDDTSDDGGSGGESGGSAGGEQGHRGTRKATSLLVGRYQIGPPASIAGLSSQTPQIKTRLNSHAGGWDQGLCLFFEEVPSSWQRAGRQ